jgi:hypothetical protein
MIIAWSIIIFLVTRFLLKVIKTPQHKEDQETTA